MTTTPASQLDPGQRQRIEEAATHLREEFAGVFGTATIRRVLRDSLERLSDARYDTFVPLLAERFTRERLRAVASSAGSPGSGTPTVLFVCVQNAGRSQMAAAWLRHLAGDRVEALSGGAEPAAAVHPVVVEAMAEVGIDLGDAYPKPWTDETVGAADVVVTMGCGDACPVLPDKRYVDWELPDPHGRPLGAVRPIRDHIRERVRELAEDLGVGVSSG